LKNFEGLEAGAFRNFGNLELLAKQVVEGFIAGKHKSPFHGFSVEFAEHRLYNPGESTKNVDWKVFARTDRMFTKRFEEETNLRCQLVIDISSSMNFPLNTFNKLQFSSLAAVSLMYLLQKQRDAFGLTIFDDEIRVNTPCKSSSTHFRILLSQLEHYIHELSLNRKTSTASVLHVIAEKIHRRSLIIIFSDMFGNVEDSEEIFKALRHLKHNKHEVILFHVTDESREMNFEFENRPYLFIDMESGEELKLQSNQVKEFYQKRVKDYIDGIKLKCLQFGIDFIPADINSGFDGMLQSYLVKRSKMRIS
jgi:uncharacterized protein (DUF58 family)